MDPKELTRLISAHDLARRLGFEPNAAGYISCPFHSERTASCRVYSEPEKGWRCFGCQTGGDQLDFIQKLTGCTFPDAMRTLAGLAGVTLPDRKPSIADYRAAAKRRRDAERREWLRAWLDQRIDDAWKTLIRAERMIEAREMIADMEEITDGMRAAPIEYEIARLTIERLEHERRVLYG